MTGKLAKDGPDACSYVSQDDPRCAIVAILKKGSTFHIQTLTSGPKCDTPGASRVDITGTAKKAGFMMHALGKHQQKVATLSTAFAMINRALLKDGDMHGEVAAHLGPSFAKFAEAALQAFQDHQELPKPYEVAIQKAFGTL